SVVIVTHDRREELRQLLSDLTAMARAAGDEIVVVDDGSADGTVEMVREEFPGVSLLVRPVNRGANAARNAAAQRARGETLVFLDDDTRVEDPRFLERVRKLFETEEAVAVVAFRILDPATRKPRRFEIPHRRKDRYEDPCETSTFISAGCAVRRSVYKTVGGMDESLTYGFEELDFSYRVIARGFRIFYRPNLWILHSLSPVARYRGRRIYYLFRNKIRISARYLPWRMFAVQLGVWSGYFLKEALRIGRLDAFVAGLASGLAGVPGQLQNRRRDRLSAVAISRLRRLEGRLYY
ncbi:MAG TPA: glycosyltransferase, partial [Candidatus Polarisedimenticolia bacterium]|nr:glycosyltransferase [Candidatus Polarisedimenticolia bacterium]